MATFLDVLKDWHPPAPPTAATRPNFAEFAFAYFDFYAWQFVFGCRHYYPCVIASVLTISAVFDAFLSSATPPKKAIMHQHAAPGQIHGDRLGESNRFCQNTSFVRRRKEPKNERKPSPVSLFSLIPLRSHCCFFQLLNACPPRRVQYWFQSMLCNIGSVHVQSGCRFSNFVHESTAVSCKPSLR